MSSEVGKILLLQLKEKFSTVGDKKRAEKMQSYMKSALPYWGIPMAPMKKIVAGVFAKLRLSDGVVGVERTFIKSTQIKKEDLLDDKIIVESRDEFINAVLYIWRFASYREEKYAAIELFKHKIGKKFWRADLLPIYEEMIVTGAWWDLVDSLAHLVGELLRKEPNVIKTQLLLFSKSDNIWKRRISIISQLGFRDKTDEVLLFACIEPSLASKEFFLRKAIGWALRQYARVAPLRVLEYVNKNKNRLSSLSYKEAVRVIHKERHE